MKPSPKKPKTKKFVGYVPKGETIVATLEALQSAGNQWLHKFGMHDTKKGALSESGEIVKRTITLTWEDEDVKEKK